jgi:Na+-transporting methylmalonyl-CoA/oxaloacetate decarboxylase gamma subunit
MQKAGGIAALYIAVAYLAAIPYFLVFVNYPSVVNPVQKVILLRDNYLSMYLMHLISFEFVAFGLIVVTLAFYQRLKERAPLTAQIAAVVGFVWAGLLLASVMVFNYGMGAVVRLYATDPNQAVSAWQVIEPVAEALGSSGGEIIGGVWILLLSTATLRTKVFPAALNWLGVGIGAVGILSLVPALNGLGVVFGLLQIVWFAWLGIVMLRSSLAPQPEHGFVKKPAHP